MRFSFPILLAAALLMAMRAAAQDEYELVEPNGVVTAELSIGSGRMIVNDAKRASYIFDRDPSFDSYDGRYQGYIHPALNRVVRFPRSGDGLMQLTDLDDARPRFVSSRRSVRRVARWPNGWPGRRSAGRRWNGSGLVFLPPLYRAPFGYPVFGCGYPGVGFPTYGYGFPTFGYGYQSFGTTLSVGPIGPGAFFRPGFSYAPPIQSIVLDSRVVPREPLPPVTITLLNSARREVRVNVTDRVRPDQSQQLRIAPGGTVGLLVRRDAGADRIRNVLTYAPDGTEITREISTPIGPVSRYELTVHEWRLQSVAIDRTGKSPNVIEDARFQGRGIGRFELPPGGEITGGTLDVVQAAIESNNAGSVSPMLDPSDFPSPSRPVSPLEQMILDQRRASGQ